MHLEQTCELLKNAGVESVESVEWRPNNLEKYHAIFTNVPPPSSWDPICKQQNFGQRLEQCALQNIACSYQSDSEPNVSHSKQFRCNHPPKASKNLETVMVWFICTVSTKKHINGNAAMQVWPEGKKFHFTITNQIPSSQLLAAKLPIEGQEKNSPINGWWLVNSRFFWKERIKGRKTLH